MKEKYIDFQSFGGGEGDSMYKVPANGFYQAENVDIRTNQNGFQLSAIMQDLGWTFDANISYSVHLQEKGIQTGGYLVCLENGKIYLDGVLKTTISTGTSAHNVVIGVGVNEDSFGTQYVYYITDASFGTGKIHRSTTSLSAFDISYREYISDFKAINDVFIINYVGWIYIAVGNKVFILDEFEILTEVYLLGKNEEIQIFTQFYGNFRIYSNIFNNGFQNIWDGVSEFNSGRQEFKGKPFLGGASDGAFDYVTVGFNENYASLLKFSGTQYEEIRINLEANTDSRIFGKYVSVRDSIVYISGGKTGQSTNYGVYTYGNYFPGDSKSLVQSYSLGGSRILYHSHNDIYSYFACADDKVYRVQHTNPPTEYALNGYIVSAMYQGGIWEVLSFLKSKMSFETNGGTINLYMRTDRDNVWTLVKSITGSEKRLYLDARQIGFGEFDELQTKIELVRGGVINTTPIVKRTTHFINVTKEE